MKSPEKVMLLVHPQLHPERASSGATERDVWKALRQLGYTVEVLPVQSDISLMDRALARFRPHVVFNLLEEFRSEGIYDFHAVSLLEALGVPYTGCNPRGLIVSRDKGWANAVVKELGIRVPEKTSQFPMFVKYAREHASRGLTERNLVRTPAQLRQVSRAMRGRYPGELIVQEFIPGRDVTVSVLGNAQAECLTPWTLNLPDDMSFATEKIKFNAKFRASKGIRSRRYLNQGKSLRTAALKVFSALGLSGYARIDFRITSLGKVYFIDANANPNLAKSEDFACAGKAEGWSYPELVDKILVLGRRYRPRQ